MIFKKKGKSIKKSFANFKKKTINQAPQIIIVKKTKNPKNLNFLSDFNLGGGINKWCSTSMKIRENFPNM